MAYRRGLDKMTDGQGNADTVTLVVTMTIRPEHEEEFMAFAARAIAKVRGSEPGTILYTLNRHPTAPHTFVWVERFEDAAALEAHAETPYMAEAMRRLETWLAEPVAVLQLAQVAPI